MLNTLGFSHALPQSSNLFTSSFDIERARKNTFIQEFDIILSTLEKCSPREGEFAILFTVTPSLVIIASIFFCIVLNLKLLPLPSPVRFLHCSCGLHAEIFQIRIHIKHR